MVDEVDPRSPRVRLEAFFDAGTFTAITPEDDRGVLVGVGTVHGAEVVAFATDPTVQGGAMGAYYASPTEDPGPA